MATIEVLNNPVASVEEPIEIHLSLSNPTYRGPAGKDGENGRTPIKGVDYFTEADIQNIVGQIVPPEIDLSDYAHKDEIPTKVSDLTNDEGFISSYTETDPTVPAWAKQPNKPTYTASEVGALPDSTVIPTVPTNVSDFVNDAGYLTSHQSLTDYATKNYVEQVVAGIETGALKRSVVVSLPSTGIDENTIYMVERTNSETNNVYDEYLYLNNSWEKIGSTEVDLTDYLRKTDLTFTNGLIESNGTVSWDLNDRVRKGTGTQAVVEGAYENTANGNYAHAEGNRTKANSEGAHAEGIDTTASHNGAHAEGSNTKAYGAMSHAEGFGSTANASYSHAEGQYTQAKGQASHAEGHSKASGYYAHSEGNWGQALGDYTHAEGTDTIASSENQHAEGKFNIEDVNGVFQHIVGNGTNGDRKNMFSRDWNGNEYLAGNLYVGCNAYSTTSTGLITTNAGGSKVATESYVDTVLSTNIEYLTNSEILAIWNGENN